MEALILGILLLLICGMVIFVIEFWWVLLIFVVVVGIVAIIIWLAYNKSLDKVVSAEIIGEEPIIEQVCENTGHTTSYGRRLSYHEHYRNRNVVTGYNVKFVVEYKNGKRDTITCKKDGMIYNKLIIHCNFL